MIPKLEKFIFFGTDDFSVQVLEVLKGAEYLPALVVTVPDRPKGRGMNITPPPAKMWAEHNKILVIQPEVQNEEMISRIRDLHPDFFIVASFGKILLGELLAIPEHGALNVHPSLLPLYRGPTPVQSQILDGAMETGVTLILMDEKMDHGPIVAQEKIPMPSPLPTAFELEQKLAYAGGQLLVTAIPKLMEGKLEPVEQNHALATFTKKFEKEDGLINP